MTEILKIGIVGIGLIGGSLLKALKKNENYKIYAVSSSQCTINKLLEQNLALDSCLDFNILKPCDVVFITTPMNKILETIDKVADVVSKDCIITDTGSLKSFVLDYVNKKASPLKFIGGHPMAGTEKKGIDAAQDDLFLNAKWVLVPSKWVNEDEIEKLKEIISHIQAKTIMTEARQHDKAVALVSHMPMLLSQALFSSIEHYEDENIKNLALKMASSGFRDMTRLAMTNPEMAEDMIKNNNKNIAESIKLVQNEAQKLLNSTYFHSVIEEIIKNRINMYSSDGKNNL
ncbi:MAG: prephenate dehydrogenase/arogenate dehydrogenase family protein [Candidatus Gastranaerophilaceae bacterium]|jgi:arogenate dehydrogenase (NADP+)